MVQRYPTIASHKIRLAVIDIIIVKKSLTIKNRFDLGKFMKKIIDLDLQTNYYLRKPGLTNLEIFVVPLKDVPTNR